MSTEYGKKFKQVIARLRENCPTDVPVQVRVRCLRKHKLYGSCTTYRDNAGHLSKAVIDITKGLDVSTAIDTLLHEWAHVLDIEKNGPSREEHRNSWGIAYARVWRAYLNVVESDSRSATLE